MLNEPKTRSPQAVTRQELLEIGAQMVFESLPAGFNVRIKDVVVRAGRTTGSAYQIWPSQKEYQEDLADYIARSVNYASAEKIGDLALQLIANGADVEELIEKCGSAYLTQLVAGPDFYASLHFWTAFNKLSPKVAAAVVETYEAIQAEFETFFGAVLAHFNCELVPPHTLSSLTMTATGLTEGAALRMRFSTSDEAKASVREAYCFGLLAMYSAVTRAVET